MCGSTCSYCLMVWVLPGVFGPVTDATYTKICLLNLLRMTFESWWAVNCLSPQTTLCLGTLQPSQIFLCCCCCLHQMFDLVLFINQLWLNHKQLSLKELAYTMSTNSNPLKYTMKALYSLPLSNLVEIQLITLARYLLFSKRFSDCTDTIFSAIWSCIYHIALNMVSV